MAKPHPSGTGSSKNCRKFLCKSSDGQFAYSSDDKFIYAEDVRDGTTRRLEIFDRHYYKLRLYNGVPVLEIDGLRMQLVRDFKTPLDYAKEVVKELRICAQGVRSASVRSNNRLSVLDTCMGLGYTAIEASKCPGVGKVTTCEISDAVITLAKWNPFSAALFVPSFHNKVSILKGNIAQLIKGMEPASFDFIIHDPPRVSHAPELYSLEFYRELHRVCRQGGRIFHYFGSVGKGKGRHIEKEVASRLSQAGFAGIRYVPRLQGVIASCCNKLS